MSKINHIAIWTKDIEKMKNFYSTYFSTIASEKYHNKNKNFTSYFLEFQQGGRIELMSSPSIISATNINTFGYAHIAVSVGTKELVDRYTEKIIRDGYNLVSAARVTGDGYYESVISDPEGNLIEITI